MSSRWNQLREVPTQLGTRTRARLSRARSAGQEGWVQLRSRALESAGGLVDRAETWPAIGRLAGVAGRMVERQRERWTVIPVADWEALNARDAVKALADVDAAGLRVLRELEAGSKNRVTVLRAIDEQLGRRTGVPSSG